MFDEKLHTRDEYKYWFCDAKWIKEAIEKDKQDKHLICDQILIPKIPKFQPFSNVFKRIIQKYNKQ